MWIRTKHFLWEGRVEGVRIFLAQHNQILNCFVAMVQGDFMTHWNPTLYTLDKKKKKQDSNRETPDLNKVIQKQDLLPDRAWLRYSTCISASI